MFYEVIPIRVFRKDSSVLTYSFDGKLAPGQIVEIPLGRTKTFGIVKSHVPAVDFPTKPITRVLYQRPLPPHILKSILWLSSYYLVPLPLVAKMFLPIGIGKRRHTSAKISKSTSAAAVLQGISKLTGQSTSLSQSAKSSDFTAPIPLNPAQKQALKELSKISTPTKLLNGVTGSGKTNIYLKLVAETLATQKSVILLVPEIALTSQLVSVFQKTFQKNIVLIHSRQTEAERHLIWESILNATTPQIIIGPRSALLSPVSDLGLIIIDEAHESTYSQDNNPKYSALRLASFIATALKIPCIFGTATPLVSDYYLASAKKSLVLLDKKAKSEAKKPNFHLIDLKDPQNFTKNRYFSDQLLAAIEKNLQNHHQTLIFHNRRGSAPLTICENCGWQALCPNCFLPLTLHSDSFNLICHTCGHQSKVPTACPDCGCASIIHKGFGTKLLESELGRLFKSAKIARFDADNDKSSTLDSQFDAVKSGEFDIIVGTQTIAKGLDLPLLATVGVVQADAGLSLPDYSSEERTFHLLTQVIGRVGRGHLDATDVFIQTYQKDHPVISAAIDSDYPRFYQHTLSLRKKGKFPPFYYLAKISITKKTEALALKKIQSCRTLLLAQKSSGIYVSTPVPAFHEHTSRGYTWQITVRTRSRNTLLSTLHQVNSEIDDLSIYLDPPTLL